MISADRLEVLLASERFVLSWKSWLGKQFNYDFVRPSQSDGVYEHIDVDSMGKRGEAVYARLWLSPVRGHRLHYKPSPEIDELLIELGDPGLGYRRISSLAEAKSWERQLALIALGRVRAMAEQHAERLAQETATARIAAKEYVRRIREMTDESEMEYLSTQLRNRASTAQRSQADRFSAGISGEGAYAGECACLAVALFGKEVDPDQGGFVDDSQRQSAELKLRLNIIADLLRYPR